MNTIIQLKGNNTFLIDKCSYNKFFILLIEYQSKQKLKQLNQEACSTKYFHFYLNL